MDDFSITNRQIVTLSYRWKLDAFRTKYVKNITCVCNAPLIRDHILKCKLLRPYLPELDIATPNVLFSSCQLLLKFFKSLLDSPVGNVL